MNRRGPRLSSGLRCTIRRPKLPGLCHYYVVALPTEFVSARDIEELHALANRVGRILGRQRFGSPECYTLIYNAARTRRCPWPHVHVVLAATVADKRQKVMLLHLKHILRWRRWPLVRWLARNRSIDYVPASV